MFRIKHRWFSIASYDTNKVNVELLRQCCSSFNSEEDSFNSKTYSTFASSYLNNCSDPYVRSIRNKIKI